jgi:hypothetical protein
VPWSFRWLTKSKKIYKSPGIDKIPAELVAAGGRTGVSEIPNYNSIFI